MPDRIFVGEVLHISSSTFDLEDNSGNGDTVRVPCYLFGCPSHTRDPQGGEIDKELTYIRSIGAVSSQQGLVCARAPCGASDR